MISLRPFSAIGNTFTSSGGDVADAINGTPMGTSVLRITNTGSANANVAVSDTAANATAKLATSYITVPAGAIEFVEVNNEDRYVASDTSGLIMILGTGTGSSRGGGNGGVSTGLVEGSVKRLAETGLDYQTMRAQLLQRDPPTTPVYALFVGDSTFAGMFSMGGSTYANARQNSLVDQLATELTNRGLPAQHESWLGGRVYTAAVATEAPEYDPRTTSIGAGWGVAYGTLGAVRLTNSTTTNPISITPEAAFDRITVLFPGNPGQGSSSINVDGGASLGTIDGNVSQRLGVSTFSCTLGTHTINIARIAGSASIIGVIPWVSTAHDLVLVNSAGGGTTTTSHAGTTFQWETPQAAAWLNPAVSVISLGINDMLQDVAWATSQANLHALISAHRAVCPVILVTIPPLSTAGNTYPLAEQIQWENFYRELATEYNCRLVVSSEIFGRDVTASIADGLVTADGVHRTPLGAAVWLQAIANAMTA